MPVSLTENFRRAYPPAVAPADAPFAYHFAYVGNSLLVATDTGDGAVSVFCAPVDELVLPPASGVESVLFLGTLNGVPCLAYRAEEFAAEDDVERTKVSLRDLFGKIDTELYAVAAYALHLLHWQSISRHDPINGGATESLPGTWAVTNKESGHATYPPVSPAVLILVHDGADKILLAQKDGWGKRYSILAGFVEPGESLEMCAIREAREEAGVVCVDPTYDGCQPWPFPHQLMVGMAARCTNPDDALVLDETELSRAGWFRWDELPELPPPVSLSRQMIDRWVSKRRAEAEGVG